MIEMWYYTSEGKQMDPVSIRDLKRLVGDGVLKPTDMVWKEGLPRWIRASSMKELFPDPSSSLDQYFSRPTAAPADARLEPPSPPAKANSQAYADDDDDEPRRRRRRPVDDEDRAPPRRRRPAPSGGGSGTLILIGFLVGGFIILGSLVVGIIILAAPRNQPRPPALALVAPPLEVREIQPALPPLAQQPKDPVKLANADPLLPDGVKTGAGVLTLTVRLLPDAEHLVKFRVKAGQAATITVTPLPVKGKTFDLNLQVFKDLDNALVVADETPKASASVEFTLPATEIVRVRVHNASKKTTVTQFTLVYDVGN